MKVITTNINNRDLIKLIQKLDRSLVSINKNNKIEDRNKYESFNNLSDVSKVFLLYDGKIAIGCAAYKKISIDMLEVKRVFIDEENRGSGAAQFLLNGLEMHAIKEGFKYLVLETSIDNKAALKFYKKMGYSTISNYPPYVDLPTSVCLKKNLININLKNL